MAALLGGVLLTVLQGPVGPAPLPVAVVVVAVVAGLRVLSVHRGWAAPVAVDLPRQVATRRPALRRRRPRRGPR